MTASDISERCRSCWLFAQEKLIVVEEQKNIVWTNKLNFIVLGVSNWSYRN